MLDPLNDGISKVELLTHMGDDLTVVNAARVSYNKESDWLTLEPKEDGRLFSGSSYKQIEPRLRVEDTKLIKYLSTHGHWTPFSHPQLTFRIKMPLFITREWYRHTVGFTRNEVSRRYVTEEPQFFNPTNWRSKPGAGQSKQGSGEDLPMATQADLSQALDQDYATALNAYQSMIELGVAPEQARVVLPVSTYTEFWETASLYAYSRLVNLRITTDAQLETRLYAEAVSELIAPLFPVSWSALTTSAP